jgi:hypothetical protein
MEIIILMCLWTERNRWVFDNDDPQNCKATFKRDFTLLWQGRSYSYYAIMANLQKITMSARSSHGLALTPSGP